MAKHEDVSKQIFSKSVTRRLLLANSFLSFSAILTGNIKALGKSFAQTALSKIDFASLQNNIKGQVVTKFDPDFNKFAYGELWNEIRPKREPQVIVRPANEEDVCTAVKFAKANKLKVVVRGGGHNWCCPSLRNGGMMIDLSNLNKVILIDVDNHKAIVQPIISNRDIQKYLNAYNLSYPSGHCPPVKLSGYLLSGGMAWNQGVWGPGVGSIEAIELVTSEGKLIKASKNENQNYFFAARGASSGFFGVACRYHLKLYPLPQYITASSYTYSMNDLDVVSEWLGKTASKLPSKVELSLFLLTAPPELKEKTKDQGGKVCMVTATVFADSEAEAKEATKLLDQCPAIDKCLAKTQNEHVNFEKLFDMSGSLWPAARRNQVEAMFSNSNPKDIFSAVSKHFQETPSNETVVMFAFFTGPNVPAPLIPDAAFSMSAHLYGGTWTIWQDAKNDEVNNAWHKKCLELLKPFVVGHYVGETDTSSYPDHVKGAFTPQNFKKIEELRAKHDPDGVFFAFSDGLEDN